MILLALAVLMASSAHADGVVNPPAPGEFDSYVLAMSDENDFCVSRPDKPECKTGAGWIGMTLHGLWPNQRTDYKNGYQYCSAVTAKDLGSDWCAAKFDIRPSMDPLVDLELSLVMPGVDSCLYNHEWYAHGTCSGKDSSDYFATAADLAIAFRVLPSLKMFLEKNSGQGVSRTQLAEALARDLGPKSKDAVIFLCRKDAKTHQSHFQEVDITLDPQNMMLFPNPASLGQSKPFQKPDGTIVPDSGNCPANGIIITPAGKS